MMIDIAERRGFEVLDHFVDVTKMVTLGSGSEREDTFWDYCPFCGDSFPESHSYHRWRKNK